MKNSHPTSTDNNIALTVCVSEAFLSFAYFGLLSLLLLFLIHTLGFSQKEAYLLWGNFVALTYVSALIYGFVVGKYITFRLGSVIGFVLMLTGYSMLSMYQHLNIEIGLTCVACGNGLVAPNLRNLLGLHYHNSSSATRDNGFTTFHIFNVVGQMIGPILLGYLDLIAPAWAFIAAIVSIFLGLVTMMVHYQNLPDELTRVDFKISHYALIKGLAIILGFLVLAYIIMETRDVKFVLDIILIGVVIGAIILIITSEKIKRIKLITLLIISIGTIAAEICFRQFMSILIVFMDQHVNRIIFNISIPANMLQSADPIFILLLFPLINIVRLGFEKRKINITTGTSMAFGLLLIGAAFQALVLGIIFSSGPKISVSWLVLFYAAISCGELFIIPIATAAITDLSPTNWKGSAMGIFFLTLSFASYLNSLLGQAISPAGIGKIPSLVVYKNLFIDMGYFAVASGIILFVIWKAWWRRYAKEIQQEE